MKRTMKKAVLLLTATTMSASILTGCSLSKTPESILTKCAKNMQKAENMDLDVNMGFHVEVEKDGTSVTMEIDLNRDLFYVRGEEDAFQIYTNSSLDLAMLGVSKSSEIEGYVVGDKDKITQYQKGEDDEEWVKSEKDAKDGVSYAFDFTNIAEQLTLAEETVTERDTECYVLEGDVKCGDIDFLFDDLAMDESEMEDVEATLTIKVAKKEQLPLSISLAIDEDELKEMVKDESLQQAGVSLAITDFEFEVGLDGINLDKEIELPKETEDAKEAEVQEEGMFDFLESTEDGDSTISEEQGSSEDEVKEEESDDADVPDEDEAKEEDSSEKDSEDDYQIDAEGEDLSKIDGLSYKEYVNKDALTSFLELTNEENKDRNLCIYASFLKDGKVVDTSLSVLEIEKDSYQVTGFSSDKDFDKVEYTYEEYSTEGYEYLGKDTKVSYEINEDVISGTVTNNTGKDVEFTQINFVVWNEDGEVIEHQYTYSEADIIANGDSSNFETYINSSDYAKVEVYVIARAVD